MAVDGIPFIVYQSEFRLYTVDGEGELLSQLWLGGTIDRATLEGEYRERNVQFHGRRRGVIYHEDESWRITATNVRAVDLRNPAVPRPIILRANQEYAIVIVWRDVDADVWLKRCYFGVKAQPANLSDRHIEQTLRLTAEEMIETAGTGVPDFSLVRTGEVHYVDGSERTLLYEYDPTSREFTEVAADRIPDAAEIIRSVAGEVRIEIGGELALLANGDGVEVGELVAIGGTFVDEDPRLEFWVGNTRCASLSVETLAAPDVVEALTPPAEGKIEVFNPDWLFSFGLSRVVAPEFLERV